MKEKLLEVINDVLSDAGQATVDQIDESMNLKDDLELDSISIAELIVCIDNAFDTDINTEEMIQTVGDIFTRLSKLEQ